MKIAAAFVGGLLLGVFLGTLATKEEKVAAQPEVQWRYDTFVPVPIGYTH